MCVCVGVGVGVNGWVCGVCVLMTGSIIWEWLKVCDNGSNVPSHLFPSPHTLRN